MGPMEPWMVHRSVQLYTSSAVMMVVLKDDCLVVW